MLVLAGTTDTLQVVLDAAHTTSALPVVTSWRDLTSTGYTPGRTLAVTDGTTPVVASPAPAASTQRVVDFLSVHNADSTTKTVTVGYDANATGYLLFTAALGPGERMVYQEGIGWQVYNSAGALKTITTGTNNTVSAGFSTVVLGSDVTNSNATANTIADVTGLSFPVTATGMWWFAFNIHYTAAATTTGSRWTINGPAFTALRYRSDYSLSTTTRTLNDSLAAYDQPSAASGSSGATGANFALIEGFITPSASGNVIARFASEVANSAIVAKAGSYVRYLKVL